MSLLHSLGEWLAGRGARGSLPPFLTHTNNTESVWFVVPPSRTGDDDPSGFGINVYYFRESSTAVSGEHVTADVRMKDGTSTSQIAAIDPGQSSDQIQFPGIGVSAVQEVLVTTIAGRCFVIGPKGGSRDQLRERLTADAMDPERSAVDRVARWMI